MMKNPLFKIFVWILATSFFFMGSAIIISYLSWGPTELQASQFMQGMMGAMNSSLMGLSMSIEEDFELKQIIITSSRLLIPLVVISSILGLCIRFLRGEENAR